MTDAAPFPSGKPLTREQNALVLGALNLIEDAAAWNAQCYPGLLPIAELNAIGHEALVESAQVYDASRGVAFSTYATFRIRGAMLDAIRAELRQRGPFIQAGAARRAAYYLADQADLPPESLRDEGSYWRDQSEAFSGGLAAAITAGMAADVLNSMDGSEEAYVRRQAFNRVIEAIQSVRAELDGRECELLDLHYGQEVDFRDIAERLRVSYSTVKRIHTSMLDHLAKKLQDRGIRSLDDAGILA